MGPDRSRELDVYLRTAVSVDPQGWAQFGYVKMPDYRWGIFLNPPSKDRQIHLATTRGEAAWQEVPGRAPRQPAPHHRHAGRHRARLGGAAAPPGPDLPSLYDLRNLFQVNVEEGATCGPWWSCCTSTSAATAAKRRGPAQRRSSGQTDNPRILQAFNEKTPDWLSFFMFTYFTDRDGKFQLCALAESRAIRWRAPRVHAHRGGAPHVCGRVGVSRVISAPAP